MSNVLFRKYAEIRMLQRKIFLQKKQIIYLVKKAFPINKNITPLKQKQTIKRYLTKQNAKIQVKEYIQFKEEPTKERKI
jgi:hypothetical protein